MQKNDFLKSASAYNSLIKTDEEKFDYIFITDLGVKRLPIDH